MPAINVSRRLILPGLGVVIFVLAHLAQNVWQFFHVDDVARAIRDLDRAGVLIGIAILGFVEATIVLCFYVPGTAVLIVLLLGMQPGWAAALPLVAALSAGTLLGYGASLLLGNWLHRRLPALIGEAYFERVRRLIGRYGLLAFVPSALHPNQLAAGFAILGYFHTERIWRYFVVAAVAQLAWWGLYALGADLIAGQNLITSSNFQLYVAAGFALWFGYELLAPRTSQ